jgi:hypothetical protein
LNSNNKYKSNINHKVTLKKEVMIVEENENEEENILNNIHIDKYIKELNEDIDISNIPKQFSIKLGQLQFNKKCLNSGFQKNKIFTIKIKCQLFCGQESYSKSTTYKWKGIEGQQSPIFNKDMLFGLKYKNLPLFSSLVIKIKQLFYNDKNEVINHKTIAWTNFKLFDHNRRLKTGIYILLNKVITKFISGKTPFQMTLITVG